MRRARRPEVNEDICARKQPAGRIVDVHFHVQRARGLVDRVGVAHDGPGEDLSRVRVLGKGDPASVPRRRGVCFRHWREDAELLDGSQVKQLL